MVNKVFKVFTVVWSLINNYYNIKSKVSVTFFLHFSVRKASLWF